jgi:hypothetical protein
MLRLNSKGLLTPASAIKASIDELEETFVANIPTNTRTKLFQQYLRYCQDLKNVLGKIDFVQWIDGSFVTSIHEPNDIDLVSFIDYNIIEKNEIHLTNLKYPASITHYGLDAYIVIVYPENHTKFPYFLSDKLYWMDKFDKTRLNRAGNKYPKGFLEMNH